MKEADLASECKGNDLVAETTEVIMRLARSASKLVSTKVTNMLIYQEIAQNSREKLKYVFMRRVRSRSIFLQCSCHVTPST